MIIFYVAANSAMTLNDHMKKVAVVDNNKVVAKFEAYNSYFVPSMIRDLQNYRGVINFQIH